MITPPEIEQIKNIIVANVRPAKIVLYGSCARHEQTEDSDLDMCIIKPTVTDRFKEQTELLRLLYDFEFDKDILLFTESDFERDRDIVGSINFNICAEGVVLYPPHETSVWRPASPVNMAKQVEHARKFLDMSAHDLTMLERTQNENFPVDFYGTHIPKIVKHALRAILISHAVSFRNMPTITAGFELAKGAGFLWLDRYDALKKFTVFDKDFSLLDESEMPEINLNDDLKLIKELLECIKQQLGVAP